MRIWTSNICSKFLDVQETNSRVFPLCRVRHVFLQHEFCGKGEGVQGVLTLLCSGATQVCHDLRVVELREQLEVEEEDGDRQEEKIEEKGEANQGECAMDGMKMILNALRT